MEIDKLKAAINEKNEDSYWPDSDSNLISSMRKPPSIEEIIFRKP